MKAVAALSLCLPLAYAIPCLEKLSVTIQDDGHNGDRARCDINYPSACWEHPSMNSQIVGMLHPNREVELICRAHGENQVNWYETRNEQGRRCYVPEQVVHCGREHPPTTACSREEFHALPKSMNNANDRYCHVLEGIPCFEKPSLESRTARHPSLGSAIFVHCILEENDSRVKSWYKSELYPGSSEYCYTPHFQQAPRPIQCQDKPQMCRKNDNDNGLFSLFNMDL